MRPNKLSRTSSAYALYQVGTGKQGEEAIHVLGNSTVRCFAVSELPLDDQERVLDFAPY